MKTALRIIAGLVALVAAWYAIVIGIDLADVLTRPINQGWIEVLLILFLCVIAFVWIAKPPFAAKAGGAAAVGQ